MATPNQRVERKLAAIFAADAAGYSRLMSLDEVETLRRLSAHRETIDGLIAEYGGRIANTAGDSILAEFPSAVAAVQCAVEVQARLASANEGVPADRRLEFRIGVHVGDVMIRDGDLFGDGVNTAARLQTLAEPGGVCISSAVHEHVRRVLPHRFSDLGPQVAKKHRRAAQSVPAVVGRRGGAGHCRCAAAPDQGIAAARPALDRGPAVQQPER
jgi:adenylate cyclase